MTSTFFRNLYTSARNRDYRPTLSLCDHIVTPEMNASLITEVSPEEIKTAVFQLGVTKAPGPDGLNS